MKKPRVPIVERDPGAVLKVNIIITLFALFSFVYVVAAAWIVEAATDAWGQRASTVVMCVLVAIYAWLLVRLVFLERRMLGKYRHAQEGPGDATCSGCGYDLRGLGDGAVCPECGKGGAA